MGIFSKKRSDASSVSVLTESEIQKKLYGDLLTQSPHVVIGEREPLSEPVHFHPPSQKVSLESQPAKDLFFTSPEIVADSDPAPAPTPSAETGPAEHAPRYVPLHDFESRSGGQAFSTLSQERTSGSPYSKPGVSFKAPWAAMLKKLLDPRNELIRRVALWTGAGIVIFLLFWGVNTLNSQREVAMQTRYNGSRETMAAPVPAPLVERPVVITPAPVRPKTPPAKVAVELPKTAALPLKGSYVIQVVTYPKRADADQIVGALTRAGLSSYVREDSRPSGRNFYQVFIGGFRTEAEAQAQLLKFRTTEVARPFQDAFVRSSRS